MSNVTETIERPRCPICKKTDRVIKRGIQNGNKRFYCKRDGKYFQIPLPDGVSITQPKTKQVTIPEKKPIVLKQKAVFEPKKPVILEHKGVIDSKTHHPATIVSPRPIIRDNYSINRPIIPGGIKIARGAIDATSDRFKIWRCHTDGAEMYRISIDAPIDRSKCDPVMVLYDIGHDILALKRAIRQYEETPV